MSASRYFPLPASSRWPVVFAKASTIGGVLLVGWVAGQALVVGEFSQLHAGYAVVGVAMFAWGVFHHASTRASRDARLHRLQGAMEGIAEAIDPLVTTPTAERPETFDDAHAPGHAHRAQGAERPSPSSQDAPHGPGRHEQGRTGDARA